MDYIWRWRKFARTQRQLAPSALGRGIGQYLNHINVIEETLSPMAMNYGIKLHQ